MDKKECLVVIQNYEAKILKEGIEYGSTHVDEFLKYNTAKYTLSTLGLRRYES